MQPTEDTYEFEKQISKETTSLKEYQIFIKTFRLREIIWVINYSGFYSMTNIITNSYSLSLIVKIACYINCHYLYIQCYLLDNKIKHIFLTICYLTLL